MTEPRLSRSAVGAIELPLDSVAPDPNQPRSSISEEELAELALSLRAHRLIQPIVVTPHPEAAARSLTPYMLLVGERRWRAARLAGLAAVPAIIRREEMSPADRLLVQIAENDERSPLGLLERALAYRRAHQLSGLSLCAFAGRCGKSKTLLSRLLRLAGAQGLLRQALEERLLNHVRAAQLFERLPAEVQESLLAAARRNGRPITVWRLQAALTSAPAEERPEAAPPAPPAACAPALAPGSQGPPATAASPRAEARGLAREPRRETIAIRFTYPMLRENLRYIGAKARPTLEAAAAQLLKLLTAGLESSSSS
jgi:ParB family transcriptional regulator, chromosome partitioning protein